MSFALPADLMRVGRRAGVAVSRYGRLPGNTGARNRSATAASRLVSGARPKRCSMVARIEVVSCSVVSTANGCLSTGETSSAGIRVPGPHWSLMPPMPVRRSDVVPLPAELVVGHDDQRAVGVRAVLDRLEQVDEVVAAGVLAGVAGVLVLRADRLDEADRLERAALAPRR